MLTTTDFERLARLQSRAMGYPDLRLISVPHPLRGLGSDALMVKVPAAVEQLEGYFRKHEGTE